MAWLSKNSVPVQEPPRASLHHTFDVPVQLKLRTSAAPVSATLLHVTVTGCRLRCWMHLERGSKLSFEWKLESGRMLRLNGAVAACYPPRGGGPGFEYAVAFEQIPEADGDALAREAAMLSRRTASARSYDTSLVDISGFTNYRVGHEFPIGYRADDIRATPKMGRACDVTGSGLRMRCELRLRAGEMLLLQFTLPDNVLAVHKGKEDEVIVGPMGHRRMPRRHLLRPFPQLKLKAKVLGPVKDSRRNDAYEMQFVELDGLCREELARYIHAAQLQALKR